MKLPKLSFPVTRRRTIGLLAVLGLPLFSSVEKGKADRLSAKEADFYSKR